MRSLESMDQLNEDDVFRQCIQTINPPPAEFRLPPAFSRPEAEPQESVAARRFQKADREKLRRDRLNEQFLELGKVLDPERPKNDKASILSDTIQIVKDLTAQVNRLKADYASLTEESRELTQEKNDLREEKASLKSDIENLNGQYQQRLRTAFPWTTIDQPVVMHPPSFPLPVPMPVPMPPGAIPMHPSLQPYPFFGNQSHSVIPNPCSTFVPYVTPNPGVEQQCTQYVSPAMQPSNRFNTPRKQDSRNNPSDCQGECKFEKSEASDDVTTHLELKTPGSTSDEDSSSRQRKSKKLQKENSLTDVSSSSRCSSSSSIQDSSSNSVSGGGKDKD